MMQHRFFPLGLITAAAGLAAASPAAAIDRERNVVDGDFETAAAWDPSDSKPVPGDHANFGASGSGTVSFNANESSDSFAVNGTNYTWELNGNTYTLGGTADRNRVDLGGHLTVTSSVAGGTVQNNVSVFGLDPGLNVGRNNVGTLILDGANVAWSNAADNVYIGDQGAGSVGVIEVRNGATFDVTSGNTMVVGRGAAATGTVRVAGANSLFDAAQTTIGSQGIGTLEITDGGRYNAYGSTTIAAQDRGTVLVDGANSVYGMNFNNLEFGNTAAAVADIIVTNGGAFGHRSIAGAGIGRIEAGRVAGSTVNITVDGANSQFFANFIYLGGRNSGGPFGTAHVTIRDGGVVRAHNQLTVYGGSTVTLDGGTVQYGSPGGVTLDLQGALAGNGKVSNIGGGPDALISTGATLDPGTDAEAGTLGFLEYNFTNDAATVFEVDIFGDTGTAWDVLVFTNPTPGSLSASFVEINGGTVNVTTSASGLELHPVGFDLVIGQTVTIQSMPALNLPPGYTGNLVHATTGGLVQANQESLRLVITASPPPAADFSLTDVTADAGAQEVVITWQSVSNRNYTVRRATNLLAGFDAVLTNGLPATSATGIYTDDVSGVDAAGYRVEQEP